MRRYTVVETLTATKLDSRKLLLLAAVLTVVAWRFPIGQLLMYPFTLMATYAHEMGHGLTAVLVGGSFERFEMYANGSGLAHWRGHVGALGRGAIAAGGLVGPSIAGALVLIASRYIKPKYLLFAIGGIMLLSVLLVVRSMFGFVFVSAVAAVLIGVAQFLPDRGAPFLTQLLGVQLCLSVFRDLDYMFSPGALVAGQQRMSDSAQIAEALLLPYWFWGVLTAVFSFVVLGIGLYFALRSRPEPAEA